MVVGATPCSRKCWTKRSKLSGWTGSEQLIHSLIELKSTPVLCASGTREIRKLKAKFGSQQSVARWWSIALSNSPGCKAQVKSSMNIRQVFVSKGMTRQAISPMS